MIVHRLCLHDTCILSHSCNLIEKFCFFLISNELLIIFVKKAVHMIVQRVIFNANEWVNIIPKINAFWETVEEYKMLPISIGIKKYKFVDDDEDN